MATLHEQVHDAISASSLQRVVALTGAGVSAESGIPTFRGPEGYWRVGSQNFHPQQMATRAMYQRVPREVWAWYLYRLAVCTRALPGPSHQALAELDTRLKAGIALISQNVDGLHRRAGSPDARSFYVHGDIAWMRASVGADGQLAERRRRLSTEDLITLHRVPAALVERRLDAMKTLGHSGREAALAIEDDEWDALMLPDGLGVARPHVLWFDESYDDRLFRSDQALAQAADADLMLVIGSSGAASLPYHAIALASRNGATIVFVDPEDTELRTAVPASSEARVFHIRALSREVTPLLAAEIIARRDVEV